MDSINDKLGVETLLDDLPTDGEKDALDAGADAGRSTRNKLPAMLRKIAVTVTLEVGSAKVSLQDLLAIAPDSVIELDRLAGEPLLIKVNGTPIGHAEVVVAGESYGLKVIDIEGLNLDELSA